MRIAKARRVLGYLSSGFAVLLMLTVGVAHFGFGVGTSTVLSESMSPVFHRGDLVLTRPQDTSSLRPGQVPALIPPNANAVYVHRILTVRTVNGLTTLTTKGDANPAPDAWNEQVHKSRTPVVVGVLRWAGRPSLLAGGPRGRALMLSLLGLSMTAFAVRGVLRASPSHFVPPARETSTRSQS